MVFDISVCSHTFEQDELGHSVRRARALGFSFGGGSRKCILGMSSLLSSYHIYQISNKLIISAGK